MKKFLPAILALALLISCSACSEKEPHAESGGETASHDQSTLNTPSDHISVEALLSRPAVSEDQIFCNDTENGNAVLEQYSGSETLVVLPETYQGKTIEKVDEYTFGQGSTVQAIKFPDSMTEIGDFSCGTNEVLEIIVTGNKTETIGRSAFLGCESLKTVELNEGLERIGVSAFAQCENLKSIYIPASVTSIASDAFYAHPENFVIYGEAGSFAETYASENNLSFQVR